MEVTARMSQSPGMPLNERRPRGSSWIVEPTGEVSDGLGHEHLAGWGAGCELLGQVDRDPRSPWERGYVQFLGCVHEPLAGSMGIHFVNGTLAGDTTIDPAKPEALIYEVEPNGQLSLVGVEYIVFQQTWDALHNQPPSLFGQPFMLVPSPNRYGIPAFYELHAWAWKANPTGLFKDWNPKVLCLGTEGYRP